MQISTRIINSFLAFQVPSRDNCSFEVMGQQGGIDNLVQVHGTSLWMDDILCCRFCSFMLAFKK